ncbi:MAG: PIG-L family deacetylase [Candidatus Alcyoniella australis]|nr:PIG-L family deacetylase [Candidatus Alcyoniella australis]
MRFRSILNFAVAAALAALFLPLSVAAADAEHPTLQQLIEAGASVMWVAPHPDDEALSGPVLALAGPTLGNRVYMLVLTRGDGGECLLPEGCEPSLGAVRHEEMKRVAELYHAQLDHREYWNAPLPAKSFPPRDEIARIWTDQGIGDPIEVIAEAIRDFRPDVLLTFSPDRGFTGHPEHQLSSRLAMQAVVAADDPQRELGGLAPYHVPNCYYMLNRYWPMRMVGKADPGPYTETFDIKQPCAEGMSCVKMMSEFTRQHRTQAKDMGSVRRFAWLLGGKAYLRRVDPFTQAPDPFEPPAD